MITIWSIIFVFLYDAQELKGNLNVSTCIELMVFLDTREKITDQIVIILLDFAYIPLKTHRKFGLRSTSSHRLSVFLIPSRWFTIHNRTRSNRVMRVIRWHFILRSFPYSNWKVYKKEISTYSRVETENSRTYLHFIPTPCFKYDPRSWEHRSGWGCLVLPAVHIVGPPPSIRHPFSNVDMKMSTFSLLHSK